MAVQGTSITEKGIRAAFNDGFRLQCEPYFEQLTTRIPSTAASESYGFLGTIPQMREWGTGRLAKGLHNEKYTVDNLEYEATIEIDKKEYEDDQIGAIMARIRDLGETAAGHKDYLLGTLLANGDQSGFNAYDGHAYFSTTHEFGNSGQQSNKLTYTAVDADNPTVPEFKLAAQQAIAKMIGYKNDQGQPFRVKPTGLVFVVPPTMMFTAMEAVSAATIGSTGNVLQNFAKVISMPELTTAAKWFLLKTDTALRPFIFQDRIPVSVSRFDPESEHAFNTGKILVGCRGRYRITYGHWHLAVQTTFTT